MLPANIEAKIERTEAGCWLWTAARNTAGYGQVSWRGRWTLAHRTVYQEMVGPIPAGFVLDHLCRVRHCVNPAHLEPVTLKANVLRGVGFAAKNAQKTHCPKGHPYEGRNIVRGAHGRTHRLCRECGLARMRLALQKRGLPGLPRPRREDAATHCARGHELSGDNLKVSIQPGGRAQLNCRAWLAGKRRRLQGSPYTEEGQVITPELIQERIERLEASTNRAVDWEEVVEAEEFYALMAERAQLEKHLKLSLEREEKLTNGVKVAQEALLELQQVVFVHTGNEPLLIQLALDALRPK